MDGDIVTEEIIDPLLQMRTLSLERLCPEAMDLTPKTPNTSWAWTESCKEPDVSRASLDLQDSGPQKTSLNRHC